MCVHCTLFLLRAGSEDDDVALPFILIDRAGGDPADAKVRVCYQAFTSPGFSPPSLTFPEIYLPSRTHMSVPEAYLPAIGLWKESFTSPLGRLETNYSGTDYLPGLAKDPDALVPKDDLVTYWGAAHDRILEAWWDLISRPDREYGGLKTNVEGTGRVSEGTNKANVVHIR
ncbi:hypothetical protein PMIN06_009226 [Paraphaeosphaeria minitans]|uniref:Phenylacetaldoxime dehydratase n=1 Tax=Paraphaeosphaeria minitans TaxID=565426 RepID=A0A9P6GUE9_9PLEO|nr:phenylacetaldoxime dehydratase [Paraphaeosphaeria minitans]